MAFAMTYILSGMDHPFMFSQLLFRGNQGDLPSPKRFVQAG